MTTPRQRTLFESATSRARVIRHIDIVCLVIDGGGSIVVPLQDFVQAQKWASARMASGNLLGDRSRLFERLLTVVSRPGSIVPTRGNSRQLESLARSMRAAGYDVGEWSLPQEVRHPPAMDMPAPAAPKLPDPR